MGRYHIATTADSYVEAQLMIDRLDPPRTGFVAGFDSLCEKLHEDLRKKVEEFNEKYGMSSVLFRYLGSPSESQ
jgi:hypothetical protein